MEKQLIFIGGPPGVGKSSVARTLLRRLENAVWLDGDDVWRMNPFEVNEQTCAMAIDNVQHLLNSFLKAKFSFVIFTWVLHLDVITGTIMDGIDAREYLFSHFTLVCDDQALKTRILSDPGRTTDPALALDRLEKARSVRSIQVETTGRTVEEVADAIAAQIG
jgi:broad-specificity NMP kinase